MAKRSAGVFLLREERGEILFLALAGRNAWDLPKGGIRSGETPFDAARRELEEETGITDVSWVETPPFAVRYPLKSGNEKEVTFFLATTKKSKVKVSSEHESYNWMPLSDAAGLYVLPSRFSSVLDWARAELSQRAGSSISTSPG